MKIERLLLEGFGKLREQEIQFVPDRVNLLVEANEFGKSTIAEAICAAIYGFRAREQTTDDKLSAVEARRPLDGGPYKVNLEFSVQGHRYRVSRDFEEGSIRVIDIDSGKDITASFILGKGQARIGEQLIALSREQFQQTCFVAHHSLEHQAANVDLKESLERMASSSREGTTVAQAIAALEQGLDRLPGAIMGVSVKVDTEIHRLENGLIKIEAEIDKLETNRRLYDHDAASLFELERKLALKKKERTMAEGLRLAAETQELVSRILEQQKISEVAEHLKRERDGLAAFAGFPAAIEENLVRWRGQLQARIGDLQVIGAEIAGTETEVRELDLQLEGRFRGMSTLTLKDKEELIATKQSFSSAVALIAEVEQSLAAEFGSLQIRGATPTRFDELGEKLSLLGAATRGDAVGFPSLCAQQQADLERNERYAEDQSRLAQDIDGERARRKQKIRRSLAISGIAAVVFVGLFLAVPDLKAVWGLLAATGVVSALASVIAMQRASVFRADDRSRAALELDETNRKANSIRRSLQEFENKWKSIAESVGIESPHRLATECLEHLRLGDELSEFRRLTDRLASLNDQRQRCQSALLPYLQRAGRAVMDTEAVTEQALAETLSDIDAYFYLRDEIRRVGERVSSQQQQLQRAKDDVRDLRGRLRNAFQEAGVKLLEDEDDTFEHAYEIFREHFAKHRRFKKIEEEELPKSHERQVPPEQLVEWEATLSESRARLLERRDASEMIVAKSQGEYARQLEILNVEIDDLSAKLQQTQLRVKNALDDYEAKTGILRQRRAELENQLSRVTAYREAVLLAGAKLRTIADAVHREWSGSLNNIYEGILATIESDYSSIRFADDLSFTVETRRSDAPLQMRDIRSRLSLGAREQLILMQRLAVSRFLSSGEVKLPFILDDPLVTSDDERFLRVMRFVIEQLSGEHQVLIFTCHRQRHDWLRDRLGSIFDSRVHIVQLAQFSSS